MPEREREMSTNNFNDALRIDFNLLSECTTRSQSPSRILNCFPFLHFPRSCLSWSTHCPLHILLICYNAAGDFTPYHLSFLYLVVALHFSRSLSPAQLFLTWKGYKLCTNCIQLPVERNHFVSHMPLKVQLP